MSGERKAASLSNHRLYATLYIQDPTKRVFLNHNCGRGAIGTTSTQSRFSAAHIRSLYYVSTGQGVFVVYEYYCTRYLFVSRLRGRCNYRAQHTEDVLFILYQVRPFRCLVHIQHRAQKTLNLRIYTVSQSTQPKQRGSSAHSSSGTGDTDAIRNYYAASQRDPRYDAS